MKEREILPNGVSAKDWEDFQCYWEHFRRNADYRRVWREYDLWRKNFEKRWPEERKRYKTFAEKKELQKELATGDEILCRVSQRYLMPPYGWLCRPETSTASFLRVFRQHSRDVSSYLQNPQSFFQSARWETLKLKTQEPAAWWNHLGSERHAWRDRAGGQQGGHSKSESAGLGFHAIAFDQAHGPVRPRNANSDAGQFHRLVHLMWQARESIDEAKHEQARLKKSSLPETPRNFWDYTKGYGDHYLHVTATEYQQWAEQQLSDTQQKMRKFLEDHSHMDFVIDTAQSWKTVAAALKREWSTIQSLRKEYGARPSRKPQALKHWRKQLEIYDAVMKTAKFIGEKPVISQKLLRQLFRKEFERLVDQLGKLTRPPTGARKNLLRAQRQIADRKQASHPPSGCAEVAATERELRQQIEAWAKGQRHFKQATDKLRRKAEFAFEESSKRINAAYLG